MTEIVLFNKREHDRSAFECGEESLDTWLKTSASPSASEDGSRTYVMCQEGHVTGYYSLCAFSVASQDAPKPAQLSRYPIPSVLLARLAVRRDMHGTGLGGRLLMNALRRAVSVADEVGVRLVVVHALHEKAASFYRQHGFQPFETDPLTLYIRIKDVRESIVAAEKGGAPAASGV